MQMDAGEICRSYAAAKDKNDQIKVLADLNDCSTQEILDVLTGGGYDKRSASCFRREASNETKETAADCAMDCRRRA